MLEKYKVKLNDTFIEGLRSTAFYITDVLKNKSAAESLVSEVYAVIDERRKMAKSYKPYNYGEKGVDEYYVKVNSFYAFYEIDEKKKLMEFHTFINGRMNITNILAKRNKI